ncbi:unnamed protein product [Rangifer tarandus platyrhynchus]|uniref:Uncharacterized protein n=1 Tax=Rangifer tarandus platyrhynchus TaxID=3082113 RepID=A0AC59YQ09_RANTA
MEPTRGGGAEHRTVSELGRTPGPCLPGRFEDPSTNVLKKLGYGDVKGPKTYRAAVLGEKKWKEISDTSVRIPAVALTCTVRLPSSPCSGPLLGLRPGLSLLLGHPNHSAHRLEAPDLGLPKDSDLELTSKLAHGP